MKHGCSGIILKDKKILLVKRSSKAKRFPDYWIYPGGKNEDNETPQQTVVREVKEEVNLEFQPTKLYLATKYLNVDIFIFLGNWSGNIKIQESEIADYGWFTYGETLKLNLAFDSRNLMEKLHQDDLI